MERPAREKSRKFAVRAVRLYKYLCDDKREYVLSKQLLRAGTSIGANLAEAECAISLKISCQKFILPSKNVQKRYIG